MYLIFTERQNHHGMLEFQSGSFGPEFVQRLEQTARKCRRDDTHHLAFSLPRSTKVFTFEGPTHPCADLAGEVLQGLPEGFVKQTLPYLVGTPGFITAFTGEDGSELVQIHAVDSTIKGLQYDSHPIRLEKFLENVLADQPDETQGHAAKRRPVTARARVFVFTAQYENDRHNDHDPEVFGSEKDLVAYANDFLEPGKEFETFEDIETFCAGSMELSGGVSIHDIDAELIRDHNRVHTVEFDLQDWRLATGALEEAWAELTPAQQRPTRVRVEIGEGIEVNFIGQSEKEKRSVFIERDKEDLRVAMYRERTGTAAVADVRGDGVLIRSGANPGPGHPEHIDAVFADGSCMNVHEEPDDGPRP